MMNNMFSIFDPSSNILNLNWLSLYIPVSLMMCNFYMKLNRIFLIQMSFSNFILKDLKTNLNPLSSKNIIIFMMIFTYLYTSNLSSLMPFIFTPTSHMVVMMTFSFPFWISLMIESYLSKMNKTLTHTTPLNTPLILTPLMVMIETVSNLIRPITLAVRMAANMIAGHILISLMSLPMNTSIMYIIPSSLVLSMFLVLELSVSIIQSYVLIILLSLYLTEI